MPEESFPVGAQDSCAPCPQDHPSLRESARALTSRQKKWVFKPRTPVRIALTSLGEELEKLRTAQVTPA
jgi:hypothetical protein